MEHTFVFIEPIVLTKYRETIYEDTIAHEQKPSEIIKLAKMINYNNDSLKRKGLEYARKEIINCMKKN